MARLKGTDEIEMEDMENGDGRSRYDGLDGLDFQNMQNLFQNMQNVHQQTLSEGLFGIFCLTLHGLTGRLCPRQ